MSLLAVAGGAASVAAGPSDPAEYEELGGNACGSTVGSIFEGEGSCRPVPPGQRCYQAGNPHADRVDVGQAMVCALAPETEAESCEANSFDGATRVLMADGSSKPISEVEVGDLVLATDPATGKTIARTVTRLIVGEHAKAMVAVTIDAPGPDGVLLATDGHRFWDAADREWVAAAELTVGDRLRSPDGLLHPVTATHEYQRVQTVYNLTVDVDHTYNVLAGNTPVLVHNSGCTNVVSNMDGFDGSPDMSGYDSGTAFSGVYDPTTGTFRAHLSVADRVADSPANSVNRAGGHGEINFLYFGGSRSTVGFTFFVGDSALSFNWLSRGVNGRNSGYTDDYVPQHYRREIMDLISGATGLPLDPS